MNGGKRAGHGRRWIAAAVLAGAVVTAWMAPALRATGGTFSAPLDDAYIHAQFARHFAAGRLYAWSPDAGVSLGETSPLYPIVLAAGYLAGFREHWIMAFALLVNAAGAAVALWATLLLVRRVAPGRAAWLAPAVLAANGAFWWGVCSGMEVGLCAGLMGLFLLAAERDWRRPGPAGPRWVTVALAALIGLGRPDMIVLTAPLLAGAALRQRRPWGWRGWARAALAPVPLMLVLGFFWLRTGMILPNSTAIQSLWRSPILSAVERRDLFVTQLLQSPRYFWEIYGRAGAALAGVAWGGVALLAWARRWRAARAARLFEFALLLGAAGFALVPASLLGPGEGHFRLYHGAFLMVLVAGARLAAVGARMARNRTEFWTLRGAALTGAVALVVGGLAQGPGFHRQFLKEYIFLADSQIAMGRLLRDERATDPRLRGRIMLHEAGAIPYFAGGDFYDMVGLCSNPGLRLARYYMTDSGLFFEALEREDPTRWPALSIVYRHPIVGFNRPPWTAEEIVPRHPYPRTGGAVGGDDFHRLGIFRFPRELLRTGHAPTPRAVPPGWAMRDRLDVGDLADEEAHAFRIDWPRERALRYIKLETLLRDGRPVVADFGRGLNLPTRGRLGGLIPGAPLQVWARVWTDRPSRYRVEVKGGAARTLNVEPGGLDVITLCELPAAPARTLTLKLTPEQGRVYFFQFWALQPEE